MSEPKLNELMQRVVSLYAAMGNDSLDLHSLFEAGGNDPHTREQVLTAISELVRLGYLESSGSDYYRLTLKGRKRVETLG